MHYASGCADRRLMMRPGKKVKSKMLFLNFNKWPNTFHKIDLTSVETPEIHNAILQGRLNNKKLAKASVMSPQCQHRPQNEKATQKLTFSSVCAAGFAGASLPVDFPARQADQSCETQTGESI